MALTEEFSAALEELNGALGELDAVTPARETWRHGAIRCCPQSVATGSVVSRLTR